VQREVHRQSLYSSPVSKGPALLGKEPKGGGGSDIEARAPCRVRFGSEMV
jgi:hypothetical protein